MSHADPDEAGRAAWAALVAHGAGDAAVCARLVRALVGAWGRRRAEAFVLRQWTVGPAGECEWARRNVVLALRNPAATTIGLALALHEAPTSTVHDRRAIQAAIAVRADADLVDSLKE